MKLDDSQQPDAGPARERLDSWKEIAAYLKREVRTVQRWEKSEGLPVRRHLHKKQGTVYAYKAELDAWWNQRGIRVPPSEEGVERTFVAPPEASETLSAGATELDSAVPLAAKWHWLPRRMTAQRGLAALLLIGAVSLLLQVGTTGDESSIKAARTSANRLLANAEPHALAQPSTGKSADRRAGAAPLNPPSQASAAAQAQPPQQFQPQGQPAQGKNPKVREGWLEALASEIHRRGRKAVEDTATLWNSNVEAGHPRAAMVRWNVSGNRAGSILDSGGLDHGPQFSPDGRRLVFASDRSGSREIWVCDADGQNAVRLTSMGAYLTGTPRWSPDGTWIVFDSYP
ncbi:MAG: hypothetical protein ACRD2Q_00810, partial [Terriglobales bacterium]